MNDVSSSKYLLGCEEVSLNLYFSEENYIDLDRMLVEKAGKFDMESFNMHDAPIMPSRIHKYDFSDPVVIEVTISFHFFSFTKIL